ncbi:MAG: response regulator [Patescibacteria group bacterium]|jgi:DNA-binding response OmpR family regulator
MKDVHHDKARQTRILIVEDESALMDIYAMVLSQTGYEVIKASDGVAGLEAAIHESPDLVLLDLALPLKDGFEVLRDLRRNPRTAVTPVIILSNLGQDYEVKTGLNLGANKFLIKTQVGPEMLSEEVAKVLAKARAAAQSENVDKK